ncbi:hypothetical protein [Variovorax sp. UC74_104]|uniref:hypothetical protein n=1 Tax=Variovorax sp. UC74_104 TaxID=3374555 RepID=UPI00375721DF
MSEEANSNELSKMLTSSTKRHIAPIFRVDPVKASLYGTKGAVQEQGTITFVKYQGKCFGLTNQHVIGDVNRPRADAAFMLALDRHTPLPGRLIFSSTPKDTDFPFDLAVFLLDEESITRGGKVFIELTNESCPVQESSKYLAVGYPGALRTETGAQSTHPIFHIVITAMLSSDRKLVFQDEVPATDFEMSFGGISGGAIFDVGEDEKYSIVGIIFQGRGHDDEVEERGSCSDIWVYGVPIDTRLFDRLLAQVSAAGEPLELKRLSFQVDIAVGDSGSLAP